MTGLGIDIGGSFIKTAVARNGKITEKKKFKHNALSSENLIKNIADIINSFKNKNASVSVCAALAGIIDSKKGVVVSSPNLNFLKNTAVKKEIKRLTKTAVLLENDANMAAYGAYRYVFKKKYSDILTVTIGTGIGGGIISGGKIYRGVNFGAGEIGHTKISINGGFKCNCGSINCLESYAGSYGIINTAKKMLLKYKGKISVKPDLLTVENLTTAAKKGDKFAKSVWEMTGFYLGTAIANAVMILNPEAVLITGGVTKASTFFLPKLKEVLKNQSIQSPFKRLTVKVEKNSGLGAIGAAFYALK